MFNASTLPKDDPKTFYAGLTAEAVALLDRAWFTNLANVAALLFMQLENVNWVGFYLAQDGELILGPFQGQPACIRIPFEKGVCGTAARELRSVLVDDVHAFPGHIACDARSRSELVIPLIREERLLGVLDMDSPALARFNESDLNGLERLAAELVSRTSWPERFY